MTKQASDEAAHYFFTNYRWWKLQFEFQSLRTALQTKTIAPQLFITVEIATCARSEFHRLHDLLNIRSGKPGHACAVLES